MGQPPKTQKSRRRWIAFHIVLILLVAYVSSYCYLSRLRWQEYKQVGEPGFLYVSPARANSTSEKTWIWQHQCLDLFYHPINAIDVPLGGPGVISSYGFEIGRPHYDW